MPDEPKPDTGAATDIDDVTRRLKEFSANYGAPTSSLSSPAPTSSPLAFCAVLETLIAAPGDGFSAQRGRAAGADRTRVSSSVLLPGARIATSP